MDNQTYCHLLMLLNKGWHIAKPSVEYNIYKGVVGTDFVCYASCDLKELINTVARLN